MLGSLFNKIADMKACKGTPTQVFSGEYCQILKGALMQI